MTVVKTFIEALGCVNLNPQRLKIYLKDKRLTRSEKTILQCWLWLRDNKFDEVKSSLENLDTKNNTIIQSQRDFLLGTTYNNQGESHRAICLLQNAIHLLNEFSLRHQQFVARINLFTAFYNFKDLKGMQSTLNELKKFQPSNESEQINLLSCWYSYYSFQKQFEKAEASLEELSILKKFMSDHQKVNFYLDQFDYFLNVEEYQKAESVLDDLKICRKYYTKANYKFMKSLLDHLLYHKPIYAYDREFHQGTQLYYQLKVIKAFEENCLEDASKNWKKLMLLNPSIYGSDFSYNGNKCLFSLCLKQYQEKNIFKNDLLSSSSAHSIVLPEIKEEALIILLKESVNPLKRDELYEKLWGKPVHEKKDLKRLTQMVSMLRKTKKLKISVRKGCYVLEKAAA